ncbi:hypothetical protein ACTNCZ_00735 [Segatella copri]|uniref:hypothetical protein n=1 Tax=Segatella copri TaxID=165179 RepID=UPI003F8A0348
MSEISAKHISDVIGLLNDNADYAVLRNFEGLPDNNKSRDIDIIITRKSYVALKSELLKLIDSSGWKIITYLHSDRLITYVCGFSCGEHIELVQWDFFFNTSVWGILLMDASEFVQHRQFNGFLYYMEVEYQFLDKYLYNRAVGSQFPDKYAWMREKASQNLVVKQKIKAVFRVNSIEECDNIDSHKLVMRAIAANYLQRPLDSIGNVLLFLWTFIRNYICSNTGFSIGFTGPDGSGKTTVIDLMIENLGEVFRKAHVYFHFRPMLFGNLGEVAHSAGIKKEVDRSYEKPHRGGKTGLLSSLLRLGYYSVDYLLGYFLRVKPVTRITRLAIFDRYYTDIICDSRRSRIYLPVKFLYWWDKCFIPSLDYNILLTARTETILTRKRELDAAGVEAINQKIDYLADKPGFYKVMNEGTPQEAVAGILRIVFERQHKKNMKKIIASL